MLPRRKAGMHLSFWFCEFDSYHHRLVCFFSSQISSVLSGSEDYWLADLVDSGTFAMISLGSRQTGLQISHYAFLVCFGFGSVGSVRSYDLLIWEVAVVHFSSRLAVWGLSLRLLD